MQGDSAEVDSCSEGSLSGVLRSARCVRCELGKFDDVTSPTLLNTDA